MLRPQIKVYIVPKAVKDMISAVNRTAPPGPPETVQGEQKTLTGHTRLVTTPRSSALHWVGRH